MKAKFRKYTTFFQMFKLEYDNDTQSRDTHISNIPEYAMPRVKVCARVFP